MMLPLARRTIRMAALLVPSSRRRDWLEEWSGELRALEQARTAERPPATLPHPMMFALGAVPHALWMMTQDWTMDGAVQDLGYAVRVLRRAPGFTMVSALTLALGIGANAAIFSLVNGLMFRSPEGIRDPERVVQVARSYESDPRWDNFSWPALELISREARTLSAVAGYSVDTFVLGRGVETEQLTGQYVSGGYFEVLGVTPHAGRLLQPTDDVQPDAHPVVVLSYRLWQSRFAGDPRIVGRAVTIGSRPYTVVGITPEGFAGPESIGTPPALWVPAMQHPGYYGDLPFDEWGWSWLDLVGRLAEGVTFEEAQASMDVVTARLRAAAAVNEDILVLLARGAGLDPQERQDAERISLVLLLIVGVVLLLTCTNLANLSLARATTRRTEFGVRSALGAGRTRLTRQLMTETVLLSLLATTLAVPLVLAADRFLPLLLPYTLSVSVGADRSVFTFLLLVGLSAGLFFGAAPAWGAVRKDVYQALREGGGGGAPRRTRLRDGLVAGQLALSMGLVAAAALLGRSVLNARSADPGFDVDGLAAAFVDLEPTGRYDEESGVALFERLIREIERLPGVVGVTVANQAPIVGGHSRATVRPPGRDDVEYEAEYIVVGPAYFETMGIPLVSGRSLGGVDEEAEATVVVNESLAGLFWPDESAIGKELSGWGAVWRVVGVVRDVQMRSLRAAGRPAVYYPLGQRYSTRMVLQVRGAAGRPPRASALREAVAAVDPGLPVASVVGLREGLTASLAETRTIGYLAAAFAILAVLLAGVGLYGLVSYWASQRMREMGIRIALGAEPGSLVRLVAGRGMAISVLGLVAGLAIAHGLGRALQALLFDVGATDAASLGGACGVLVLTAAVAAWHPARRAGRVDAAVSLRE